MRALTPARAVTGVALLANAAATAGVPAVTEMASGTHRATETPAPSAADRMWWARIRILQR